MYHYYYSLQGLKHGEDNIHTLVYEKLLDANLEDVVDKGFFSGIDFFTAGEIEGRFLVQVNSVSDVTRASYKFKIEKNDVQCSNNRLLLLDITDGKTYVKAIEFKKIEVLSSQIESGSKIMLSGKIKYNLNIILLTSENVHLCKKTVKSSISRDFLLKRTETTKTKNVVFISSIRDLHPTLLTKYDVIIKAHISRVANQIAYDSDYWVATLTLEDDVGYKLEVMLSNEILEMLIGLNAAYLNKQTNVDIHHAVKTRVSKGLVYCQAFISRLKCYMMLTFYVKKRYPIVIKLLQNIF